MAVLFLLTEREGEMPIYLPKPIVPLTPTRGSPLFFLGGPVRGGGDWQAFMAERIFARSQSAHIAIPCRWTDQHRMAPNFLTPFSQAENRQLVWERYYLKKAGLEPEVPGCVIFWLGLESTIVRHAGPEPYAMDTRREVGKFIAFLEVLKEFPELRGRLDVRVVVGGSRYFHGLDVILFELSEAIGQPFPYYGTMEEVAEAAMNMALR